jgi:hypothetical protein
MLQNETIARAVGREVYGIIGNRQTANHDRRIPQLACSQSCSRSPQFAKVVELECEWRTEPRMLGASLRPLLIRPVICSLHTLHSTNTCLCLASLALSSALIILFHRYFVFTALYHHPLSCTAPPARRLLSDRVPPPNPSSYSRTWHSRIRFARFD